VLIVKIIGGLGNQMFQYAYAKALSEEGYKVKIDTSFFANYKLHQSGLDSYDTDINISSNEENNLFYKNNLITKILKKFNISSNKMIKEKDLLFDVKLLSVDDNNYIEGYFQCEKYFLNIRDKIINDFIIKNELSQYSKLMSKEILNQEVSISLHIRRGDYISDDKSNDIHGVCTLDYYYKAIELMNSKFKNTSFYIFSDDIHWAKENLEINNATYIDSEEQRIPHEDIYLMSLCDHNIIANSSFSWWGAWLNQNNDKIVVAPERWFSDEKMYKQSSDIACRNWIKI
jgi:hypothetical protein